jgi:hypothetical protein
MRSLTSSISALPWARARIRGVGSIQSLVFKLSQRVSWSVPEIRRVEVVRLGSDVVEGVVEHAGDVGALVVDDLASLLVPEDWNRDTAGVLRVVASVDLHVNIHFKTASPLEILTPRLCTSCMHLTPNIGSGITPGLS